MCSNSPHKITDYLQYDYVGAPWIDQVFRVGNGGFSLRSRSKMVLILRNATYTGGQNEDIWFVQRLSGIGIVAPVNVSKTFAVETMYYSNPLGVHKPKILKKDLKKLCAVCPEARLVPPYCM